jgi:hypothetical protein
MWTWLNAGVTETKTALSKISGKFQALMLYIKSNNFKTNSPSQKSFTGFVEEN